MEITLGEVIKFLDNIMTNYFQWYTEWLFISKKVYVIEEINSLSVKMDELMNLVVSRSVILDFNDIFLFFLIESSNVSLDVNFVGRNNFGNNNVFRGNYVFRFFFSNFFNNFVNFYNNINKNYNKLFFVLDINIKVFINF